MYLVLLSTKDTCLNLYFISPFEGLLEEIFKEIKYSNVCEYRLLNRKGYWIFRMYKLTMPLINTKYGNIIHIILPIGKLQSFTATQSVFLPLQVRISP